MSNEDISCKRYEAREICSKISFIENNIITTYAVPTRRRRVTFVERYIKKKKRIRFEIIKLRFLDQMLRTSNIQIL